MLAHLTERLAALTVARQGLVALALGAAITLCLSACAPAAKVPAQAARPTASAIPATSTPIVPTITFTTGSAWIPLASTAPDDLIAAARDTLPKTFTGGDGFGITASTPAGTPALVWALRTSEFPHLFDLAVVPFLVSGGAIDVTLELNADHTAFQADSTMAGGDRPQGVIWQYSAAQAVSALQAQRQIGLAPGFQPILVFWSVNLIDIQTGIVPANAGFPGPIHPSWLLRGTDGVYYILANTGRIYALSEMPLHTLPPAGY